MDNPSTELDVNGTVKTSGFQLTATDVAGFVLQANQNGDARWEEHWKKEYSGVLSSQRLSSNNHLI